MWCEYEQVGTTKQGWIYSYSNKKCGEAKIILFRLELQLLLFISAPLWLRLWPNLKTSIKV